ncbi:MAG: hypothetical protein AAF519_13035 [Bacteroidota bacterium]
MKPLTLVLSLLVGTVLANDNPSVELLRSEYQNHSVLTFKIDKELIGATLKIVDADGVVISTTMLSKKKETLDFSDLQNTEYIVSLEKDDFQRVFKIFNDIEFGVLYENYSK